jgi:hypothetical protein
MRAHCRHCLRCAPAVRDAMHMNVHVCGRVANDKRPARLPLSRSLGVGALCCPRLACEQCWPFELAGVPHTQPQQYDSIPVFSFGATGEIYSSNLHAFRAFGIDHHHCKTLASSIHFKSIKWAADILRTRRAIDKDPHAHSAPAAPCEGEG